MAMDELKSAIINALSDLEPAECQPDALIEHEFFEIDTTAADNSEWLAVMRGQLADATAFRIHCWEDEEDDIALALQYGSVEESNWRHGVIIAGAVTDEFRDMLLSQPKPAQRLAGNAFTPFFTIQLDNGFESGHYGTELIKVHR